MRRLAIAIVAVACTRRGSVAVESHDAAPPVIADAGSIDSGVDAGRAPLSGVPWQIDLPDDDAKKPRLGVLSIPLGAREPRPIMIALHGGSDRPEWACGAWRGIANGYPFLVCPRGIGADASLAWSSPPDTKARIARAVAATKKRFPEWIRETKTIVLVGFSMGATQAAFLAEGEPSTYPRIALAESAYAPDPVMSFARGWTKGGGERAIFLCTTGGCEAPYRNAAKNVAAHHASARMNVAGTNAHGMWDVVVSSMRRDWPWLVENVEGWESYVAPAEDAPLPGRTEIFDAK